MGNLPSSRTITLTPSDPVPSSLLNELQDQTIGHKRRTWTRSVPINFAGGLASAWQLANKSAGGFFKPMIRSTSSFAGGTLFIPFEDGDRITGVSTETIGDGTVDSTWFVFWSPGATAVANTELGSVSFVNHPTTSTTVVVLGPGGSGTFSPQVLSAGDLLWMVIGPSAQDLFISPPQVTFDRL
jgi:hypothetical protein